jgi:glycosyltransferase involved in cell wall biosynthesis
MFQPAVTILLPVYNSEKYVRETIKSLLDQTFSDFEILVIDDGSTDTSAEIIQSYKDERIVYVKNHSNKGLIYTLNKGIELSKGKYIARMDADDICKATRIEKQYNWLEKFTSTSVVGCHVSFINDDGEIMGEWKDDIEASSYEDIRRKMSWVNCIAHPTVMIRSEILKRYRYHDNQKNTEDYDLWLRLFADKIVIEKVPEKLLLYRAHDSSITSSILRKSNPFFKQYQCKRRFLWARIKNIRWGWFESKVLLTTIFDGLMGIGKNIKGIIKG